MAFVRRKSRVHFIWSAEHNYDRALRYYSDLTNQMLGMLIIRTISDLFCQVRRDVCSYACGTSSSTKQNISGAAPPLRNANADDIRDSF